MDGVKTRLPGRAETPQHGQGSSGTVLGVTGGSRASPGSRQAGCLSTAAPSCFAASNVLRSHSHNSTMDRYGLLVPFHHL